MTPGPAAVPAEALTAVSPRPFARTVFTQRWCDLTMLHWAVPPAVVAPLLPPGTRPDTLDGHTYVGLIPFRMRRIGVLGMPGLPYLGSFAETNVRLYSVDARGRRGVVFRSLEAARLLPVLAARWVANLPYQWARIRVHDDAGVLRYETARRWPGPRGVGGRIVVRPGPPMTTVDPLSRFLTARWGLHSTVLGRGVYWPNEHVEWPLRTCTLLHLSDTLVAAAGLPGVRGAPDSVLFSPGVEVRFGPWNRMG
ncbi:MAG: DUF2071 domain-containing protein [Geodermatophilaceae bacterium]|nr:DUF2071 domain-containing protein [Geodermatophilaceae bacterium]